MGVKTAITVALLAIIGFWVTKVLRLCGILDFQAGKTVQKLNSSYDFIVVGGGSAGAVVAARLSENSDINVLLVEAGGEETDSLTYHVPGFATSHLFTAIDWALQIEKPKNAHPNRKPGNEEFWANGRVLGGGSIINYLQYVRGSKHDFDAWEQAGCTGWSYKDVLPYFLKSEDIQVDRLKDSKYHSTGGFLGVTDYGATGHPLQSAFLKAGHELGYQETDYNGETQHGFSTQFWTGRGGIRTSPSRDLLRQAMRRPNMHVTVRSTVTKVLLKDNIAEGVDIIKDNRKYTVMAKREVIVSAGAIGSPKLLMLSGIGPKEHLREKHIPVVADLPVGKNLQYHLFVPLWTNINNSNYALTMPSFKDIIEYLTFNSGKLASPLAVGTVFTRVDGKKMGMPDLQINLSPHKFPSMMTGLQELSAIDRGPGLTFAIFSLHPKSTGHIKLRSVDAFDAPIIEANYFAEKEDLYTLVSGIRFAEKIILSESMKPLNLSIAPNNFDLCSSEPFASDAYWACFVRNVVTGSHQSGTCKMGSESDPEIVVDPELRVKGIRGLRVIDASIMPMVVSGNIHAACIMIGEKGADLILQDLNKRST